MLRHDVCVLPRAFAPVSDAGLRRRGRDLRRLRLLLADLMASWVLRLLDPGIGLSARVLTDAPLGSAASRRVVGRHGDQMFHRNSGSRIEWSIPGLLLRGNDL